MRTIKQAEEECRKAWAENPSAWGWCVHHEKEVEELIKPIENRIAYILANKSMDEIVIRLDNLRPVLLIEAVALAWKTRDEAFTLAWKTRDEAFTLAWKTYDEASTLARKTYDEAFTLARKTYDEASTLARKTYDEAVAPAHRNDVPNHTWNGVDIFGKK